MPNPWDAGTARALEGLGFSALATTSSGFAWTVGRPDNRITLEDALTHMRLIAASVAVPVNADFEGGFAVSPEDVASNVTRAVSTGVAGLSIEQQDADVLERVSNVVWTMTIPMADINVHNLQIFSNAKEIVAVAAATGAAPFDLVPVGSFSDTVPYRIMFVAQKLLEQGAVIEPTTLINRGRWDAILAYRAKLTAGTQQMSFGKGALLSMPVTMKFFPEPGEPQGEEYHCHMHERAATIA